MNISSSSDESVSPFLFSSIDFFIIAVEPVSAIPIKMDASFYLSKKTFNKSRNCLSRGIDVFFSVLLWCYIENRYTGLFYYSISVNLKFVWNLMLF